MNWWLVTAYAVFFVGVSVYTLLMGERQRDLDRRIAELRMRIGSGRVDEP